MRGWHLGIQFDFQIMYDFGRLLPFVWKAYEFLEIQIRQDLLKEWRTYKRWGGNIRVYQNDDSVIVMLCYVMLAS